MTKLFAYVCLFLYLRSSPLVRSICFDKQPLSQTSPAGGNLELQGVPPSPTEQKQLNELLTAAKIDTSKIKFQRVSSNAAFCNQVFYVQERKDSSNLAVAKLFSELALMRVDPLVQLGEVDRWVTRNQPNLVSRVLASNEAGILFEYFPGKALSGIDLCRRNVTFECHLVGSSLARLHAVPPPPLPKTISRPHMLWRSCNTMLDNISNSNRYRKDSQIVPGWTLSRLEKAVTLHKKSLESLDCPPALVDVGHGDFKPANILIDANRITLIDFELAGLQYRAFDLAKYVRSDRPKTKDFQQNTRSFYNGYIETYSKLLGESLDIEVLENEVASLMPMTWLEAAIFFACQIYQGNCTRDQQDHWRLLASDRLAHYEECL